MASMVEQLASTVSLPVRPGGYTVADIDALPETRGVRFELIDGVLIVSPMPRMGHQLLVQQLGHVLAAVCPSDLVVQPFGQDVRTGDQTNVVPDLMVHRLRDINLDDHVAPAPLLAVEVISPSSRWRDLGEKLDVYQEMGTPSYWVLHPVDDWVRGYELTEGLYELVAEAAGDQTFEVSKPFPVSFRPADLLARFRER